MRKIRINELARELEVKAHEIIDKLPELGVADKKTHSSSIDDDVADKLRVAFGHEPLGPQVGEPEPDEEPDTPAAAETPAPVTERAEMSTPAPPAVEMAGASPAPAAEKPDTEVAPSRPTQPIRPPLAGPAPPAGQTLRQPGPAPAPAPAHTPVAATETSPIAVVDVRVSILDCIPQPLEFRLQAVRAGTS